MSTKQDIADKFDVGMRTMGFIYLQNHNVDAIKINKLYNATKEFFHLPLDIKKKYQLGNVFGIPGYLPYGLETTNEQIIDNNHPQNKPDKVEHFKVNNNGFNWFLTTPKYNEFPPQFYKENEYNLIKDYVFELRILLSRLHVLASFALGLDTNKFEDLQINSVNHRVFSQLRLNHYFELNETEFIAMDDIGLGAHTDFLSFTILYMDETPGLQAMVDNGEWIDIPFKENAFIINIGDFVESLSGKRWKSSKHRVVRNVKKERISITFFTGPNLDEIMKPFDDCIKCETYTARKHCKVKNSKAQIKPTNSEFFDDF
eukprot:376240_1